MESRDGTGDPVEGLGGPMSPPKHYGWEQLSGKRKTRLWLEALERTSQYVEKQRKQGLGKSEVGLNCIAKSKMLSGKRKNTD